MLSNSILYKNTEISFIDQGKGNTLVFLHGFLENKLMWKHFIEYFSQKNRVISIDLLGHGQSGCTGYIYSMEDMADAVFAVLNSLKIKKATLAGHSMGGYVALAFGELYPDNVRKVILVSSTSKADSEEKKVNRDRSIEIIKKNSDLFVSMAIQNTFTKQAKEHYPEEVKQQIEEALKTPKQGILAAIEGMKARIDREVLLHFAPYPISIILGKDDPVISQEESTKEIEGTSIKLDIINGGHMLQIEAKEELLESLKTAIK